MTPYLCISALLFAISATGKMFTAKTFVEKLDVTLNLVMLIWASILIAGVSA